MTSKTNRSGDVISQPGRFSVEATHTHTHTYTPTQTHTRAPWRLAFLQTNSRNAQHTHTHTLTQILTSRSVKAECREEMRTDNVLNHWATLLSPSRPRAERFVTGLLSPCYYAALFFFFSCHLSYLISSNIWATAKDTHQDHRFTKK